MLLEQVDMTFRLRSHGVDMCVLNSKVPTTVVPSKKIGRFYSPLDKPAAKNVQDIKYLLIIPKLQVEYVFSELPLGYDCSVNVKFRRPLGDRPK
jgi:hypothetical protein